MGDWIGRQLDAECRVLVRPPYVLAGDLQDSELQRYHDATIVPAARAMVAAYGWNSPREPVIIVLLSSPDRYRRAAERLSSQPVGLARGFFEAHLRLLVVNTAGGDSAVYHELTHALMDSACPDAPPWLSEGLAALNETAERRGDRVILAARDNGRLWTLKSAIRDGRLEPLADFLRRREFNGREERVHYAYARYFCLYLEEKGVLRLCCARLREACERDPSGVEAVGRVLPGMTWPDLNMAFRNWALARTAPRNSTGGAGHGSKIL